MRVLILGDSHLARAVRQKWRISLRTTARAVGGSTVLDLDDQLGDLEPSAYDVVVISSGTNEVGWRQVPFDVFTHALREFLDRMAGTRVVFVASPGADEARAPMRNAELDRYAAAAATLVGEVGGTFVDTPAVLAELGEDAFLEDGFHLSPAGYRLLLPAIHTAVHNP